MPFKGNILANGQLPNVQGILYTCPVAAHAYVKYIGVHNTAGGGTEAVFLYARKSGGTARLLSRFGLAALESGRSIEKDETINLGPGDTIEGVTTTIAKVDYLITGVEET